MFNKIAFYSGVSNGLCFHYMIFFFVVEAKSTANFIFSIEISLHFLGENQQKTLGRTFHLVPGHHTFQYFDKLMYSILYNIKYKYVQQFHIYYFYYSRQKIIIKFILNLFSTPVELHFTISYKIGPQFHRQVCTTCKFFTLIRSLDAI